MQGNYNIYDQSEAKEKAIAQFCQDFRLNRTDQQVFETCIMTDFNNNGNIAVGLQGFAYSREYSFSYLFQEQEQIRGMKTYLNNTIAALWDIYRKSGEAIMMERKRGNAEPQGVSSEDGSRIYDAARILERVRNNSALVKMLNRTYYE